MTAWPQSQEIIPEYLPDVSSGQFSFPHPTDQIFTPVNSAVELLNIDIDKIGISRRRKGYELIADDLGSSSISGLIGFSPSGGTKILVTESDGTVYTWANSGNWSSSQAGLTAATTTDFVVAKNLLFRLGQTDNIRSFDGSSWTDEGDTNTDFPKAKMGIWISNQVMLAANTTANPEFVYYSSTGDPQSGWNRTTNAFAFGPNDAIGIAGIIEFTSSEIVVFTQDAMWTLNVSDATPDNWTIAKIAEIGCEAHRTVRQLGGDVLFLSRDGLRSIAQSAQDKKRSASLPLSYPIQDWIERINWVQASDSLAWVWQDKYYLSVPIDSATSNSHTLVFSRRAFDANGRSGGWSIYENVTANAFGEQKFSNNATKLYFGEASADGKVYFYRSVNPNDEVANDNGTAITYSETGRRINFNAPHTQKTFQWIEIAVLVQSSGELKVEAQVDGGGFTTLGNLDQTGDLPTLPINLPFSLKGANIARKKFDLEQLGRGRDVQIRLTEGTLDADTQVLERILGAFIEPVDSE